MSVTSKTGLVPIQRKIAKFPRRIRASAFNLPLSTVTRPAQFSIRPFGGLYNPYAKGCSVLCNHPAPSAVRTIIRKVKDSWSSEGKSYWPDCVTHHQHPQDEYDTGLHDDFSGGNIPEDLFRRFTDTDSRPLTPSPTTASVRTRTSAGSFLNARRCVTPEPGKDAMIKRKKIILDLRRSHSQETLYWRASSEVSQCIAPEASSGANYQHSKGAKVQKSEDHASKKITNGDLVEEDSKAPLVCINDRDVEDNGVLQRRGKRRKKSKTQPLGTTFCISQDPETQIATLGPDSLSASTRPSLIPNTSVNLLNGSGDLENKPAQLKDSFLTEEAFRVLKTELDIDVIENTFERYLNRALREAIRFLPGRKSKANIHESEEIQELLPTQLEHNKIPRKFSKSASRFEIPIDLYSLSTCTVFKYLSKHVWVSRQRKQLYKRTFLKFVKEEEEPGEEEGDNLVEGEEFHDAPIVPSLLPIKERFIPATSLWAALKEILGFYGTDDVVKGVVDLVGVIASQEIYFRPWCGIVAFAERYALADPTETDSCDELEKTDFDTLEQRIDDIHLTCDIRTLLTKIREGHCVE